MEHGKGQQPWESSPLSQARLALGLPHRREQMFRRSKGLLCSAPASSCSCVCTHLLCLPRDSSCSLSSLQDISLPFLCLLSKPPFLLWHSQQGKAPFAPTNHIQPHGFSTLLPCLWHLVLPGWEARGPPVTQGVFAAPLNLLPTMAGRS